MNLRDAAQQALEALDGLSEPYYVLKAQDALRAALAQPEQEPVAWMHTNGVGHRYFRLKPQDKVFNPVPLYTAPPRREWRGLTDKEIGDAFNATNDYNAFARAIEAALKEKNK